MQVIGHFPSPCFHPRNHQWYCPFPLKLTLSLAVKVLTRDCRSLLTY